MERFADSVRTEFPEFDITAKIEAALETLIALKVDEIDGYALCSVAMLPFKIVELLQVGLRRSVEMTGSSIREINRGNVSSASVLVRGVFETTAVVAEIIRRVQVCLDKATDPPLSELHKWVTRTLLGSGAQSKTFVLFDEWRAPNVLTPIQNLTEKMGWPLEGFYEGLSEYSHPSCSAMVALYTSRHHGGITQFTDRNEGRGHTSMLLVLMALGTSLDLLNHSHETWTELRDLFVELVTVYYADKPETPEPDQATS
jgi:hypothetical protein